MLFARIPLTILAGLALVNGHQLAKRQALGGDVTVDTSAIVASATSVLGSLSGSLATEISSLLAEATGSGGLGVVPSILESYLSEATGILGTGLGGVTGTGTTATGATSAPNSNNAAMGVRPMGAMSTALLAGLATVSAGLVAGAWFVL